MLTISCDYETFICIGDNILSFLFTCSGGDFTGLQTWDDPTPRPSSQYTYKELQDDFIAACKNCNLPWAYKMPMPEHLERLREQNECKMLEIALHSYANQKNMLPAELEIMELKERSFFWERRKVYGHFNFLVKDSDGTLTLFFAEVDLNCKEEKDVYLCCPLEENDNGNCFGCREWDVALRHPTSADYLGGHKDICDPYVDTDDEYFDFM